MPTNLNELIYEEVKNIREEQRDGFEKMNGRVRKVEEFQAKQKGVMAAGGVIVAAISWFLSYIHGSNPN